MLKRYTLLLGFLIAILIAGSLWASNQAAWAQDGANLLKNGSFEPPYYGQGASTRTVPDGWTLTVSSGSPVAFPHSDQTQVLDGSVSWNLNQGYVAFTATGYQQVSGLNVDDGVKFTAYGWVYTCDDTVTSCVIPDPPYRESDPAAGASLRVGIDPEGGIDPNASSVKWSTPTSPYDRWAEMSVAANAKSGTVTVFVYMTQTTGLALNHVYWDNASLVRTEVAPDATEVPAFVPFVEPQNVRADGSIIHVVQANDTLSSIAFAYEEYGVTNESIAELNGIKPNTRFLQIGQELIILPPGSVDPATGQLVPEGQQPTAQPEPTQASAATLPPAEEPAGEPVATSEPVSTEVPVASQPVATESTTASDAMAASDTTESSSVTYATVRASFYPFERGFMFWLEDTNQIYVLVGADDSMLAGTYSLYVDTWRDGMPETDPQIQPPDGFTQPERGFGHAWRTYPGVRDSLGWGTGSVQNYTALAVRDGETLILSSPDRRVYQLTEEQTWSAMDYNQE